MDYRDWLANQTNRATIKEIASQAGLDNSTLGRQLSGKSTLDAASVVKIARALNLNVLESLVAAGYITAAEANTPSPTAALADASDVDLAREILRRAEHNERMGWPVSKMLTTPTEEPNG